VLKIFLLAILVCGVARSQAELSTDGTVDERIRGGESRAWQIRAEVGQYIRILVKPGGIPLKMRLVARGGAEAATFANQAGEGRAFAVSFLAEEAGPYRLELSVSDAKAASRRFGLQVAEQRQAVPQDRTRIDAERLFQAGKTLQIAGQRESLGQAIEKYNGALELWRSLGDQAESSHTLNALSDVYLALSENGKARDSLTQSLALARAAQDTGLEAEALCNLGAAILLAQPKQALDYLERAVQLSRSTGDRDLESTALNNLGSIYNILGNPRKAMEYATQALAIKRELGDRAGAVLLLTNVGVVYYSLGETRQALAAFQEALPIRREMHDARGEGNALFYLGSCLATIGDLDQAQDAMKSALPLLRQVGDRRGELRTLSNLGIVYLHSGQPREALDTMKEVLPLARELGDRVMEEGVLTNMGRAYVQLGEADLALDYSRQALTIQRQIGDRRREGLALSNLGSVYSSLGQTDKALESYRQALPLLRETGERGGEAETLNSMGTLLVKGSGGRAALPYLEQALALCNDQDEGHRRAVILASLGGAYRSVGEKQKARDALQEALPLLHSMGDRLQQSVALFELARLDRDGGDWHGARGHLDEALQIDEQIRGSMVGQELRSAYFATVLDQYELLVDVLMHLHEEGQAFETAERARARTLLDSLSEARGGLRNDIDSQLLDSERILTARLHAKTERQIELASGKPNSQETAAVESEIRQLTLQYQELEARILAASPKYAAFAQPEPLTLAQLQHEFLGSGTLLLEYFVGEERSYVWVIGATSFRAFQLPKRAALEEMAQRAYEGVHSVEGNASEALTELSRALLGPVSRDLGTKRLVVVAPGALEYVPFAALSAPGENGKPLIAAHEVANLPSASTVAFLRRKSAAPHPSKVLAVLADPVFSSGDPRLEKPGDRRNAPQPSADRELPAVGFERLTFTRREAAGILAFVPPAARLAALDFDANRSLVTSGTLRPYRFVHIASHGLVNSLHPELSSIVLSTVDRGGHPQNGLLQTIDIYNLSLSAELVVLSACQTALGKEIRGEGLVGLTRAFLYAGAPSVVASLWTVSDRSTAELMTRFYRGILVQKLRPAAALREAQVSLWKEQRWSRPYYWAAFTLEGEWE
jgi:CHAT domain-containing protein/Tfp pilus assembly protein PilF